METDHSESVRDQVRRHAALFDTRRQAVIATTLSGEIVYWSDAAEMMYGWSEPDVLGKPIVDITPTHGNRDHADAIMDRLREGRSWSGEFTVCDRNGVEFEIYVRDIPVKDEAGKLIGIVGISSRR